MSSPLPATTTAQEDITALGRRKINIIWETTQALVTVLITGATIYCQIIGTHTAVLEYGFVMVLATYLARTNHTKIGGVGPDSQGR